eukprot:4350062-Lingulodinium_polyedra.AAC.1
MAMRSQLSLAGYAPMLKAAGVTMFFVLALLPLMSGFICRPRPRFRRPLPRCHWRCPPTPPASAFLI